MARVWLLNVIGFLWRRDVLKLKSWKVEKLRNDRSQCRRRSLWLSTFSMTHIDTCRCRRWDVEMLRCQDESAHSLWLSTIFDDAHWHTFDAHFYSMSKLLSHFLNLHDLRLFWHFNDDKTILRRMVPLPARLVHGYPQGWFHKISQNFTNLLLFRYSPTFSLITSTLF